MFTALNNILLNNLASSDCKKMINSSLESSKRDESNGGKIISLRSILTELSLKTHLIIFIFGNWSSDWISMILPSLDSSRYDESNGDKIIFLRSILTELLLKIF
jgi:hypothetical protein